VATKAFLIGLLLVPATIGLMAVLVPYLLGDLVSQRPPVTGTLAVIDRTGVLLPEIRRELLPDPDFDVTLIDRPPDADLERERAWLRDPEGRDGDLAPPLALVVLHADAVTPAQGESGYGSYDLYVSVELEAPAMDALHDRLREAIVGARADARGLDRQALDSMMRVPRPRPVRVDEDPGQMDRLLDELVPMAFALLMFVAILTGGAAMLTSTTEEKSSRVVEVLLSAVSPMQLMAGKLLGHRAVSLLTLGFYVAMGAMVLGSFSLAGLLDVRLLFYLLLFFVIGFLVIGSLMLAVGASVEQMSEAQSLQMPIVLILVVPFGISPAISHDPDSLLAVVMSFLPPINGFGMLMRMASASPPPAWQVWLSVGIGIASVFGALWVAAKVFRIGLLMHGKPPNFATLVRWARSA